MLCRGSASRRSCRIGERSVRRKSRPILVRIVNFENDRFVTAHLRKIDPAVLRIVLEPISLAHPVWVAALRHHQIVQTSTLLASASANGLDWIGAIDRAPYLNDREAALEQFVGFVRQNLSAPVWTGPFGVVVVRLQNRGANEFSSRSSGRPSAAHDRISPLREAPDSCLINLFDLRVINGLQLVLIEEIRDLRLMSRQRQGLARRRERRSPSARPLSSTSSFSAPPFPTSSVNVLRAEGFVDENFTVVNCVRRFQR